MASVDLAGDLDMIVARDCVRPWMDRAIADLTLIVQQHCPPAKVWQTRGDDKVRISHQHAEGQAVPVNLRFILERPQRGPTVKGQAEHAAHRAEGHHGGRTGNIARKPEQAGTEQAQMPRDPQLSPGNRYNCRCNAPDVLGMIAATVYPDPVEVAGTVVRGTVGSRFPRIAESEFGNGEDPGLHFMAAALNEFASKVLSSDAHG